MRRVDQRQQGASAVEFALIVPLFASLLFGIVEFGMILYTKGMMTHAAREGARYGVIYGTPRRTDAEIRARVREYLDLNGLTNPAAVTVTGAGGGSGAQLNVTVDYAYQFMVIPQGLYPWGAKMADLNLRARTVMLME